MVGKVKDGGIYYLKNEIVKLKNDEIVMSCL
jgi:hypothetical protein